jgi:hypothetical protein
VSLPQEPHRYEEWLLSKIPDWLLGIWGDGFFGALGYVLDATWWHIHEATKIRYVDHAPSDALPYLVQDADVPVFLTFDTEGEIRARVAGAWTWHEEQGTGPGIDATLEILGFDPEATWTLDASNTPHWLHEGGFGSQWCVVAKNPIGWGLRTETWDELEGRGLTWDEWEALGESWDYTAPASLFTQLYEFLWRRKWAHGVPVYVGVAFGDGYTWDELQARELTWDDVEALGLTWDEIGDVDARVVVQTARIWDALDLVGGNNNLTWDQLEALGVRWARCATSTG